MPNNIHPTAVIDDTAKLGNNNTIGPFCYIGPKTVIGDNNVLTSHVVIGGEAQHRTAETKGWAVVGNHCKFHEFSQVHRATSPDAPTRIGDNAYIMTSANVAHDCILEDDVTLCSNTLLGGHCYIMQGAMLGYGTTVHQRQVIGSYVQTGMGTVIPKHAEIEPCNIYVGNPAQYLKQNDIGIERNNLTSEAIQNEQGRFELLRMGWSNARTMKVEHSVEEIITLLREYFRDRSPRFKAVRWDVCDAVVGHFGKVPYDVFRELFDKTIGLLWQQQDNFIDDQKLIAEKLIAPARKLFKPEPLPGGDKVAWLVRNCSVGMYAPYKHVRAFIQGMVECGEPPLVYVYGPCEETAVRDLIEAGLTVRISSDPAEIRAWCELDGVGTLIADSYSSTVLTLFEMRSAPLQIYLSPGFQLFPADVVLVPPTQIHLAPKTEPVHSPMLWEHLYQPTKPTPKPNKVIFGVLGRYEKISAGYLDMVSKILDAVPGSEFHAYGRGTLEIQDSRIIAKGATNPHMALSTIDVYLDTWPLCGGVSVWEAMAHRVPVITRASPDVESWNVFKPNVVNNAEDYIKAAVDAVTNPQTDAGYRIVKKFTDTKAAGQRLLDIIHGREAMKGAA